jgi:small-conductance mechanosensitive channel
MADWVNWLADNWILVVIPLLSFIAIFAVGLLLRMLILRLLARSPDWSKWRGSKAVSDSLKRPFLDWFFLLGSYVAVQVSSLSSNAKNLAAMIIGSLFVVSVDWVIDNIAEKLIRLYTNAKAPTRQSIAAINVLRAIIIVVAILIILSIWGFPINPILWVIALVVIVVALTLRDVIANYFSSLQVSSARQIKVGDFIKLDSGESGHVISITWQNTQIKSLQGDSILIPNSKLARTTVTNYGHLLKKATDPFHFNTRLHLRELTGIKACNVNELFDILREAPDNVVFYHVHHFLEENLYLTPEPTNDFAIWVNSILGDDILGERLASIDTFAFPTIGAVKQRLVDTLADYLRNNRDERKCHEGEEFHFIRSVIFILPTSYVAHDLREFVEILRKVTIDSIYFHVFESRLRLQKGTNDFSIWIAESLGEKELADEIASIVPYVHTLENLRNLIISRIEKYIK